MKRGKKYVEAAKLIDRTALYDRDEAIALVKKAAAAKFDETVEAHIRTGCDGRHADQQIRGAVVLPTVQVNLSACWCLPKATRLIRLWPQAQSMWEQRN